MCAYVTKSERVQYVFAKTEAVTPTGQAIQSYTMCQKVCVRHDHVGLTFGSLGNFWD